MSSQSRPPDIPEGALRVQIKIDYFSGKQDVFYSWNPPKIKPNDCILIRTDYGVVRIEWGEVSRCRYAAVMKEL